MKRYEMRFVTERGRIVRGPIFKKKNFRRFKELLEKTDEHGQMIFTFNHKVSVIPEQTVNKGYAEIKPVGLLYALIRTWRAR